MAPEYAPSVVIFDSFFSGNVLKGSVQYVEPQDSNQRLRVRWSVGKQPEKFRPVGDGVAYIYDEDIHVELVSEDASPTYLGDSRYQWTEGLHHRWQRGRLYYGLRRHGPQ